MIETTIVVIVMNSFFFRLLDLIVSILGLTISAPVLLAVAVIGYFDTGSPIFIQNRVGKNKLPFSIIKFRTMEVGTEAVASHLASVTSVTKFGAFLRKTKIDELPQLFNVLKGEMSLVGPRPCLFSQKELIEERDSRGVFDVLPGITGLSQINKIDMSTPQLLSVSDHRMIQSFSAIVYFKCIFMTVFGKGSGDRVG